ncbi:MAG: aldehyde dehydrogenase family protein [Xanthomonadales bacterium]|nr:aldehyde dehydrogenase family protein [Xanthomonadales bacterium]
MGFLKETINRSCSILNSLAGCISLCFGRAQGALLQPTFARKARSYRTPFGLAAAVFTRDLQTAHGVIARLKAGTCWINTYNITPVEMPFGGMKLSDLGRENTRHAMEHYTQFKSV